MSLQNSLPAVLALETERQLASLRSVLPALDARLRSATDGERLRAELELLLSASPFCAQLALRRPAVLMELLDSGRLEQPLTADALDALWDAEMASLP